MHLADPDRALAEMARVTRPGGRICVFDFDWLTLENRTARGTV
jgi:ubiquinone/menaquinone biosynthesis C-methylase UbiE